MGRLKHHFNRFESIARDSCIPFSGLGARECKKPTFCRLGSSNTVMQPRVSIRPLKFECPDCGSTWQEESISTHRSIVFKKPPCPKCDNDREVAHPIAA